MEEKNSIKGKLKSIKEKLLEVVTTLGTIQNDVKSSGGFCGYVDVALEYAGVLKEALDAALKVQEEAINFEELSTDGIVLAAVTSNMTSHAEEPFKSFANHSENAKQLQQSVYLSAMNIKKTIQAMEGHSKQN
ncbi:hypothetical protein DdX_20242 [Ditylenchus destructor]|uniref:Uncharacterized protein n=1 Tax=Ditylenchus destructor TaxID=166010 RepID=A0AAD4MHI9_9BILA|nr:hypothetical protein DdX_20240 [Ditylenchus destructor]KAI1694223.1 hypothetical protein DdX_20242 [Ditylenchus destructor]